LLGKYLLVSELHNAHIVRQVFFEWQFVDAVLEHNDFLKIYFTR